jgi:glycolate oxidase FAD binding subunit
LWRISVPPASGHRLVDLITPAAQMFYDWGGGLVWLGMPYAEEPDAASVRAAVAELGGHATLIRAEPTVRATVDVFQPEEPGVAALNRRVKESFDPKGVLNPGRMWAGV